MAKHIITPAWQTSRGALVQAHGCAVGVPVAGAKVFGETRQNLWVNPSTVTKNGVTLTSNDDGSITLSGTATASAYFYINSYIFKPGTQYCFSGSGFQEGSSAYIQNANEANYVGIGNESKTFTTKSDFGDAIVFGIQVAEGTTVNATVRVMLNEGSEAQPWCPPGLNGVEELSVVTGVERITCEPHDVSAVYAVAATLPEPANECLKPGTEYLLCVRVLSGTWYFSEFVFSTPVVYRRAGIFALPVTTKGNLGKTYECIKTGTADQCVIDYCYLIEDGVTTPIDLDGHQLRSLPDGTRDVLTVDGSGAVVVEQAVSSATFDGSSDENWALSTADNGHGIANFRIASESASTYGGPANILCDTLSPDRKTQAEATRAGILIADSSIYIRLNNTIADTVEELKTWLAANPTTVIWKLKPPRQTVPLDPIAPPTVPAPDASLWAASDVPCDLEATTWTASGAEQGRQQAAMVKVAQQVRQQAETVAALAAQSLEA